MIAKPPAPDRRPMFQKSYTEVDAGEAAIQTSSRLTVTPPATMEITEVADGTGTLVGVRIQPDMLARLDSYRGGKTRPQAIRELLDARLPQAPNPAKT